jgi:type III secretion protein V
VNPLHALLGRLRGAGDALFALAVLAVVVLLVAPLTPALLDAGIALNLALAAGILVVTLFAGDALRFASFPSLLLLTTLFRLALNVGSTRLVLSEGDAGRVIEAFGRIVVRGNWVVGAVVYAVLTLVQLLVVAKGAERVAEVAARFTLDALPGKQMAIDADLRAGLLDAAEARRRRRALERESQLHGAMDGALKFVKGDAIAGVAIVLVNVVGGLVAGAARGMDLAEAARRYTVLAIGDGLASQIPALLLAVSAGVAVTRVAGEEEGATLGGEIGRQLFSSPAALGAVAALCGALALAPGIPALPFLVPALAAGGGAGWLLRRSRAGAAAEDRAAPAGAPAAADAPLDADAFAPPPPVVIELAPDLLALARAGEGAALRDGLAAVRERLAHDLGVVIPAPVVRAGALAPGCWALRLDDVPAASGRCPAGEVEALAAPDMLALAGIAHAASRDPLSGRATALVAEADRARAGALGEVRGPVERTLAELAWALERSAHHLVGVQEIQVLLDGLEPSAPALVREVTRQLPPALLADVLRRLVEEGVSIRPLRTLLQAMLEAGGAPRGPTALAEACRRALRAHIGRRLAGPGEAALPALLLDARAEERVRGALTGEVAAVDPAFLRGLLDGLGAAVAGDAAPPVVLTSPDVRRAVRGLVAPSFPRVAVLAYEELPPDLPVRPVGRLAAA